jgi:hypothetical protein
VDTGVPIHTETVTVTAVHISIAGCSISTSTQAYAHNSFYLQSATAGLQEAINYAGGLQATVVLTPLWTIMGGTNSTILAAAGNSHVSLTDDRANQFGIWTWTGSGPYIFQSGGGGGSCVNCVNSSGLTTATLPIANGSLSIADSNESESGGFFQSTLNGSFGSVGATASISFQTTTGTDSFNTTSGTTGTTISIPPSLGAITLLTGTGTAGQTVAWATGSTLGNATQYQRGATVINAIQDCGLQGGGMGCSIGNPSGTCHDDGAAMQACVAAHPGRKIELPKVSPSNTGGGSLTNGDYYFGTHTITLQGNGQWLAGNTNDTWSGGTSVVWDANTAGMVIPPDCVGCKISDMELWGPFSQCWNNHDVTLWGNFGIWDGVAVYGGEWVLDDVQANCFNGNGFEIIGWSPTWSPNGGGGEPDNGQATMLSTGNNHGVGILIEGGDANVGHYDHPDQFNNEQSALWDNSALGNVITDSHANGNGNNQGVNGGINSRKISAIQRTSNVVTACPYANVSGFAIGNTVSIDGVETDSSFNGIPFTLTFVSAANAACPVTGEGSQPFGYVQWSQSGSDTGGLLNPGGAIGIKSDISSITLASNVVTIVGSAPSTSITPSDLGVGIWLKIFNTGNAVYDGLMYRKNKNPSQKATRTDGGDANPQLVNQAGVNCFRSLLSRKAE